MMRALSALGDTALLAPAALAITLYLAALRRWVEARAFVASLAFGLGATLVFKLLFKACGGAIEILDLNSPSGHASFATLFYGALAVMIGAGRPAWQAALVGTPAVAIVAAIGASRAIQGAHSWEEVILGWLIGLAGLAVFVVLHRRTERGPLSPVPLAIGLALAVLLVDGRHFSPEHYIGRMARYASTSLDVCTESRVTGLKRDVATMIP
jgi:membrane-associated phospholipid phosphatase